MKTKKINSQLAATVIQARPLKSHKGNYGRLLLIGGTYPYGGAIIMAALAAVNSGAGLVTVATERENIASLHAHLPEAMAMDLTDTALLTKQIEKADVILIGPGLNENTLGKTSLNLVLSKAGKNQLLILDGGALNLFAQAGHPFPSAQLILTPHQKEWERLSGIAISDQDCMKTHAHVNNFPKGTILVQKQHGTLLLESGNDTVYQLTKGGPYQATGGMGDTLAGIIAAFLGQFPQASPFKRVMAATYLHSAIAEKLAQTAYVVLPTAISQEIPRWMKAFSEK